ncbi:hypothetical protein TUM4438_45260 [Shewanella sairae]|uniref:Chromosome partitioning protein ParB n=1 Tax=Shewanella sairae TaxID=190310 RepID=A0ABQ4PRS1_9GAMM|nr:hypothetical protein [Shewanella sairae]MCL1132661.1 hypothetical protein [Shewanella sairae]GIU52461.1 hypothetical protein TUM4438_45260 [Shewanella sairae]
MKAPELADLSNTNKSDDLSKAIVSEKIKMGKIEKKTFSLTQGHLDYIFKIALSMSKEKNKSVSNSEALRNILDQHSRGQ